VLIQLLENLIGKDILLWGASLVIKPAGAIHPWHCDIESSSIDAGKTVSVWIGLENTSNESSLELIPYSHQFNKSVQQVGFERGVERAMRSTEEVLKWAQNCNSRCSVERAIAQNGSALFFHGKIWHGSHNRSNQPRTAILLQYATPDAKIRIPDSSQYDWPFRQLKLPKPPCILVTGDDGFGINRIIPGPPSSRIKTRLILSSSRIQQLTLPLPLPESVNWKPYYIFNGKTAEIDHITCHVSALRQGFTPHPPHTHKEEELLIVLDGTVDVILPEIVSQNGNDRHRLQKGQVVYYPAHFPHTLETTGNFPASYLMIKWYNQGPKKKETLPFILSTIFDFEKPENPANQIHYQTLFEGPTESLQKLHCHCTIIKPGASYAEHIDPYDVAIFVFEGTIETIGQRVEAGGVVFYPSGRPHGMSNPTKELAKYVVFEFHGDKQFIAQQELIEPNQENENALTRVQLQSLKQAYLTQSSELDSLRSSYSLKFGRFITKSIVWCLGWIPPLKKWILDTSDQKDKDRRKAIPQ
jgi:quercetin dioxygenase-like cupin family protein